MPRTTDNSYRLFAAPPSPGTDMKRLSVDIPQPSKSTTDLDTPARDVVPNPTPVATTNLKNGSVVTNPDGTKAEVIKGPWRLLRLLPRESRHILSMMLEIDPKKRASMADVLEDPWVSGADICRQEPEGKIYRAEGHTHTLEPPTPPAPAK